MSAIPLHLPFTAVALDIHGGELGVDMYSDGDSRVYSQICARLTKLVAGYQAQRLAIEEAFRGDTPTGGYPGSSPTQRMNCEREAAFVRKSGDCFEEALTALRSEYWARVLEIGDLYEMLPRRTQERWNQRLVVWRQPGYRRGEYTSQDLPDLDVETAWQLVSELPQQRAEHLRGQLLGILSGLGSSFDQATPDCFPEHFAITWQGRVESRRAYEQIAQITSLRSIAAQLLELDPPSFESTAKVVTQISMGRMGRAEVEKGAFEFSRRDEKTVLISLSHRLLQKLNSFLRVDIA
ncbi:hypothetical protein ACF8FF_07290 [Pseudomonas sp. zjy_13]|uniref:hypothetical protein n=1 Tax=Pseudomonas sp. zjy_13 TaxID=3367263 RepID=UPI00370A789F